ncbi:BZ3500_MvSof-1268-A1-R1_Chr3-1g06152 [Microbotryum saponariae]|uniref:BZ3500_MvSof-1268-A1-R1_Chr3-1g06152 protein n=1 Tax=Microbotryum saponariae TaxID=289078 RepID=A0A2X0LKR4_9BASI|nr:BZ3500_MvSof-1268-A1-R1_Chr3-1g06152 [Microbotryum saponariae]SDA04015.1 BZ3501_MvSof-1269-A2-R1_Chr3-2g05837 [Microbotryum saponariae]
MASSSPYQLGAELALARAKVAELEQALQASADHAGPITDKRSKASTGRTQVRIQGLSQQEYRRYGRQMILPAVGLPGQLKLKQAHILVIGAGGLGCPVLLYLAAAGVGQITILDHDDVELSNLHRQVLHDETRIGFNKAESARIGLERLNSDIIINSYALPFTPTLFDPSNCSSTPDCVLKASFTLVLDCTDNAATRHFLNAYAVRYSIPLVSGGAVRAEGTVGVFGLKLQNEITSAENGTAEYGPCYACVFPAPPSPLEDVADVDGLSEEEREDRRLEQTALQGTGACSDEGVLGLLCGQVGVQMGCEAMRVLLGMAKPTLHLLSPLSAHPLRTIKLRARQPSCPACGADSTTKWEEFLQAGHWSEWIDPLCELPGAGQGALRKDEKRWSARALSERLAQGEHGGKLRLIDVRPGVEWGIYLEPKAKLTVTTRHVDIPLAQILRDPSIVLKEQDDSEPQELVFVCRRGNDSIVAARAVKRSRDKKSGTGEYSVGSGGSFVVGDLKNGLVGWSRDADEMFPTY